MKASAKRRRMPVADLAESVGLGRVHTMVYGIMSLPVHGREGGLLSDPAQLEPTIDMLLHGCNGLVEAILRVCGKWLKEQRALEASAVIDILYPPDLWPPGPAPTEVS